MLFSDEQLICFNPKSLILTTNSFCVVVGEAGSRVMT